MRAKPRNIKLLGLLLHSNIKTERIVGKKECIIKNSIKDFFKSQSMQPFFATKQVDLSRKIIKKYQQFQKLKVTQQK